MVAWPAARRGFAGLAAAVCGPEVGSARRWGNAARGFASASDGASLDFDVAVVGGGMVGAGLAAALATTKMTSALRIAVIDRAMPDNFFDSPPPEFPGLRVSTLTPATTKLLQRVGAWGKLAPPVGAAFADMQVWDDAGPGYVRYGAAEVGAAEMGHVVENEAVQSALLRVLAGCERVELLMPAAVAALELPPYGRATTGSPPSPLLPAGPFASSALRGAHAARGGGRCAHAMPCHAMVAQHVQIGSRGASGAWSFQSSRI
mmetsp:Transcript_16404/g.42030  ORF Transcript_16404/g.42030 Transcript_16404/m.42030 type:complete len:261 (-) Transcript_16404:103-885(-)